MNIKFDETVKANIERNSTFCIYVEQPLHDVTFIEEKIEFPNIPREYDLNCINIKKLEIMTSSQKQKAVRFQDYSIKFVADLAANKVEAIIDSQPPLTLVSGGWQDREIARLTSQSINLNGLLNDIDGADIDVPLEIAPGMFYERYKKIMSNY